MRCLIVCPLLIWRYFLRLTIIKRFSNVIKEEDVFVHALSAYPELNNSIKMEVGIEDCLHIEFEYNKSKYHLKDVIIGKIYFLLVRIKVKYMELAIMKREIIGDNAQVETESVAKYEIMDGAPVKGESIPIRLFLGGYDLTPTMRDVQKKFSCKYYLNLVLVDEEVLTLKLDRNPAISNQELEQLFVWALKNYFRYKFEIFKSCPF